MCVVEASVNLLSMKLGLKYLAGKHERYDSNPAQHRRPSAVKRSTVSQESTCEQQASQHILFGVLFRSIPKFNIEPNTTALLLQRNIVQKSYMVFIRDIKYSTKLSPLLFRRFPQPNRFVLSQPRNTEQETSPKQGEFAHRTIGGMKFAGKRSFRVFCCDTQVVTQSLSKVIADFGRPFKHARVFPEFSYPSCFFNLRVCVVFP